MVRHEAAEALGGIATPEVLPHLREWLARDDAPRVVRESCEVALDMYEVRLSCSVPVFFSGGLTRPFWRGVFFFFFLPFYLSANCDYDYIRTTDDKPPPRSLFVLFCFILPFFLFLPLISESSEVLALVLSY